MCAQCTNGLTVSINGNMCINCTTVPGCSQCSSDNVCAQCTVGYTLNSTSNTCITCEYPCKTCQPASSICATCASPYSAFATAAGVCYSCSVPNCNTCNQNTPSTCTGCQQGYTLIDGQCQLICVSNLCVSCPDPAVCRQCQPGYVPSGNTCIKCANAPACTSCNPSNINLCSSCNTGYYLSNSACIACSSNCASCDVNGCNTFKESTGQITVRINGTNYPAVCDAGCQKCSNVNPSQCITCMQGFFLTTANTCQPCQSPCRTCSSSSSNSCLSCYNNAFLSGSQCLQCAASSNCLTCSQSNTTQCLTCPYGYSLNSGRTCSQGCPNNCLACSNSTVCTLCIEGYSPNTQGVCLPCLSNCRGCSSQANAVCVSCGQGFFVNSNQVCQACSSFCLTCSNLGCNQCMPGYTLTSTFTCQPNCKTPCATCSASNSRACTSCLAGYTYNPSTSSCNPITTCSGGCVVCPFNYVLSNQQCLQCGNTACARCSPNALSTCTACYDGYFVNQGSCSACPTGCQTCSNANNCLSCSSGYTAQVQAISTQTKCIACASPCAQCVGNAETCTVCQSGYSLMGWKCMTNFNFGFSIVLGVNLTTFYANYANFLTSLSSAVGSTNINSVTMVTLAVGSVVANGNLNTNAPTDSNQASTQYDSLTSMLASGNSIAGMPVQSSTVAVNGGTIVKPQPGPNLALILGITIPIGVICKVLC